jgi:hypothetical protein
LIGTPDIGIAFVSNSQDKTKSGQEATPANETDGEISMGQIRQFVLLFILLTLTAAGCTTLPDVKPFADSTAGLAAAAGTHYREVASDVASLKPVLMPGEKNTDTTFKTRKE